MCDLDHQPVKHGDIDVIICKDAPRDGIALSRDAIDELVDWQLSNKPLPMQTTYCLRCRTTWTAASSTCPHCGHDTDIDYGPPNYT